MPGSVQRNQKHGQALVLGRLRVGVGDEEDVLAVVRAGGEHLRPVDHPLVAVADRAGLAGRDVRAAFGFGVAQAHPDVAAEEPRHHLLAELGRSELLHRPRDHRAGAPGHPRHVRPPLLQFPDAPPHPAEAAVGRRLPLPRQVTRRAQRQVHAFVEVVAGLAVAADDVVGHVSRAGTPGPRRGTPDRLPTVPLVRSPRSAPPFAALARRDDLGDVACAGSRIAARQRPSPGPDQIGGGRGFRRNAKSTLDMHGHRGGLGRFLGHEHECRRRPALAARRARCRGTRPPCGPGCVRPAR